MRKLILIVLVLAGCTGPSEHDIEQNKVIMEIANAHNQLVSHLYPTPTATAKP